MKHVLCDFNRPGLIKCCDGICDGRTLIVSIRLLFSIGATFNET